MKLVNQVILWDVYVTIPDNLTPEQEQEEARTAALALIRDAEQPLRESESNTLEVRHEREIRSAWHGERPIVSAGISDEDFEHLKGKTTAQVFAMLHTKAGAEVEATKRPTKKAVGAK